MGKRDMGFKELAQRKIGLGRIPQDFAVKKKDGTMGQPSDVLSCGFTQVPVLEYVTWTVNLPLTDTSIAATFGDTIDVLDGPKQIIGVDAVDSSFVINGILQTDMLAVGFGIHVFGEPQSFVQDVNALSPLPAAGTAAPMSPDVFDTDDVQTLGLPAGGSMAPGILLWGMPAWEAGWHLANAYQFIWTMHQRYQLVNELVADVCYFGPYADAEAAGTSEKPVHPFARQINDHYRTLNASSIAVPVNSRRMGVVTAAPIPAGTAPPVGVFRPTRDFDLAPVTWGGLRYQGGEGCCLPFRKLPQPVLLERGIPIGMKLQAQDAFHQAQMRAWLSLSQGFGGSIANFGYDANVSDLTSAVVGVFPELSLDQGANTYAQARVNTNRTLFKGGAFKLAMMIKGFEVWGPWKDYFRTGVSGIATENSIRAVQNAVGGGLPPMRS